jgi:cell division protein FtsN
MNLIKRNGSFKTPRTFNLTLTIPGLTAWAVGLVVLLSSFFALGVVVGRSYRPRAVVLTQPSDPAAGKVLAAPDPQPNATAKEAPAPAKAETVLKPEELQYMERLKHKPETPAQAPAAKAVDKPQPGAKDNAKDAAKDAKKSGADKKDAADKNAAKDKAKKDAANADPEQQLYNYQYQVASFKKQDVAEDMRKKVAKLGLDTVVQAGADNGQSWYRVVVRFSGKPEDTRGLKEKLATIGVSKPILLSKRTK